MATSTPDSFFDYQHFTLDKLDRIVPVTQTRQDGGMDFTLLALECYQAGFSANILVGEDWQPPEPGSSPTQPEPPRVTRGLLLVSEAHDDLGNRYSGQMRSGSGGGGVDGRVRSHFVYCFAPSLNPAARNLTLTLIQVERPQYDADGRPTWLDEQVLGGPWTMSFALDGMPDNGMEAVNIIPVARQIHVDDISLGVTTIERYPSRFVANIRLDWTGPGNAMPFLACYSRDNRGGKYGKGNCASAGGGLHRHLRLIRFIHRIPLLGERLVRALERRSRPQSWRMNCEFKPEIDLEATELALEFRSLRLSSPVLTKEERPTLDHWEPSGEVSDLGTITVPLSSQPALAGGNRT